MAAKLRNIFQGVNVLGFGVTKLRTIFQGLNVLWNEETYWATDFSTATTVDGALPVPASRVAPLVGRWTWSVTEQLAFRTEILAAHDRTEQRIAHRGGVPLQSIATRILLKGDDKVSQFEAILHNRMKSRWPIPLWHQARLHTASLPAESSSISVDTRYSEYRTGGYAMIWQNDTAYEIVEISSFSDSALTLAGPTVYGYAGNKWIMPCRIGWVVRAVPVERLEGGALYNVTWTVDVSDVAVATGFAADLEYDGYTVLTTPSRYFGDSWSQNHSPDIAILDSGSGPFEIVSNSPFNEVVQDHAFTASDLASAWSFRQWLYSVVGRQKAFLVPTFRSDILLTRPCGASDTTIYVANHRVGSEMDVNAMRTYVAFRPAGSQIIVRKVTSVGLANEEEDTLTLDVSPGSAFSAGAALCWVDRCRLANDVIDLEWYKRGACTCETQMVRVTV